MSPGTRRLPTSARRAVIFADEDGVIDRLRERMRQAGYRPICASDAGDAIAAITHEKPALVVVHLGRSTGGRELLRRLDHAGALAQIPRVVIGGDSPLRHRSIRQVNHAVFV